MIFAIATPPGRSAIGIIRFSGKGSLEVIQKLCTAKLFPIRQAIYTNIQDGSKMLDDIILILFKAPHSYTGEDSGEIHAHGNPLILKKISDILFKHHFKLAQPGEFTKKAYLNKKMNISQAEAVQEIIDASDELTLQNAMRLKKGEFRNQLLNIRTLLLNIIADLTAEIDFSDEDISLLKKESIHKELNNIQNALVSIIKDSNQLRIYKEGIECLILGKPNVGKSSFLNLISGKETSIVTSIPGTTRDFNECRYSFDGLDILFVDTAGIREKTQEPIEKIGIKRSVDRIQQANLILYMFDGSIPVQDQIPTIIKKIPSKIPILFIVNKNDSLHLSWKDNLEILNKINIDSKKLIFISILQKKNIQFLKQTLEEYIKKNIAVDIAGTGLLLSQWQTEILTLMKKQNQHIIKLLEESEYLEIIVSLLEEMLQNIAELTGEINNEVILGRIFSRFCIGK